RVVQQVLVHLHRRHLRLGRLRGRRGRGGGGHRIQRQLGHLLRPVGIQGQLGHHALLVSHYVLLRLFVFSIMFGLRGLRSTRIIHLVLLPASEPVIPLSHSQA